MKKLLPKISILLGLLSISACQQYNFDGFLSKKNNDDNVLQRKKLIHISGVATNQISVRYLDYNGNQKIGNVDVLDQYQDQVKLFFDVLYKANFHIANLESINNFGGDIGKAFAANATFSVVRPNSAGGNDLLIFLNPISNPTIFKNDGTTLNGNSNILKPSTGHAFKASDADGGVIIVPASGLFSANHNRAGQPNGAVHQAIVDLVKNIGVSQILTENDGNTLYYGLFKFGSTAPHFNKTSLLNKAINVKKQYYSKRQNKNYQRLSSRLKVATKQSNDGFSFGPLPKDIKQYLIDNNIWNSSCPVSMDRLSYLTLKYYDYDGTIKNGDLIMIDVAAQDMLGAFKNLFDQKFPLEKVSHLIESDYKGGTQSFICRPITGGQSFSLHAYGTAIDISWYRNPYIGLYKISPDKKYTSAYLTPPYTSLSFLYRDLSNRDNNEQIKNIIQGAGFYRWGGDWYSPTDYMHFETSRFISQMIAATDFKTGQTLYRLGINYANNVAKLSDNDSWSKLYQLYPNSFSDAIKKNISLLDNMDEHQFFDYINGYLQSIASSN